MAPSAHANALEIENVIKTVFLHLSIEDICRVAGVCRAWRSVAADPDFWRTIDVSHRDITPTMLVRLLQRQRHVEALVVRGVELSRARLAAVAPALTSLRSLVLEMPHAWDTDMATISANFPALTSLMLAPGSGGAAGVQDIFVPPLAPAPAPGPGPINPVLPADPVAEFLAAVAAAGPPGMPPPAPPWAPPQGQAIVPGDAGDDFHAEDDPLVAQHFAELNIPPFQVPPGPPPPPPPPPGPPGNPPAAAAVLAHPGLRCLRLEVNAAGLLAVACPALTSLEVSRLVMPALTLEGCVALEEIAVVGGHRSGDRELRGMFGVARPGFNPPPVDFPALRCVRLTSNSAVTDDFLDRLGARHPGITALELRECSQASGAGLAAPVPAWRRLVRLALSDCESMTGSQLERALARMPELTQLELRGCNGMSSFTVESASLRRLALVSPRAMSSLDVRAPNLEELSLEPQTARACAAHALRTLTVASGALRQLRLVGCPILTSLTLACPALMQLDVEDCDELRDAAVAALSAPGALPELRDLRLVDCGSLRQVAFTSPALVTLRLAGCARLGRLRLACDALAELSLEECGALETVEVASRVMTALSLGSCPSIASARLDLPAAQSLELRGCNQLVSLALGCPALRAADATLCSSLTDAALVELAACPALEDLQVGACGGITARGVAALAAAPRLRRLDLAYVPLEDPAPLLPAAAGALTWLALTDCYAMDPAALGAMLRSLCAAPHALVRLDASYCGLPPEAVAELALAAHAPAALAINGVRGRAERLWPALHAVTAPPSPLRSLSLIKSRGMETFFLGMAPTGAPAASLPAPLFGGPLEVPPGYVAAATPLQGLEELRLGVGEFSRVAVALPSLLCLELNSCLSLREAALACPSLERMSLAACRGMTLEAVVAAVTGCPSLTHLDLGHCPDLGTEAAAAALRGACPSLQRLELAAARPEPMDL